MFICPTPESLNRLQPEYDPDSPQQPGHQSHQHSKDHRARKTGAKVMAELRVVVRNPKRVGDHLKKSSQYRSQNVGQKRVLTRELQGSRPSAIVTDIDQPVKRHPYPNCNGGTPETPGRRREYLVDNEHPVNT